jgi:hypothetical protein
MRLSAGSVGSDVTFSPPESHVKALHVLLGKALLHCTVLLLLLLCMCRMAAAVASLFQDVSVRFLEERTERALQRCAADSKGEL